MKNLQFYDNTRWRPDKCQKITWQLPNNPEIDCKLVLKIVRKVDHKNCLKIDLKIIHKIVPKLSNGCLEVGQIKDLKKPKAHLGQHIYNQQKKILKKPTNYFDKIFLC